MSSTTPSWYTNISDISKKVSLVRNFYNKDANKSYSSRVYNLNQVYKLLTNHKVEIVEAINLDLRKNIHDAELSEVSLVLNECSDVLNNLSEWMKPIYPDVPLVNKMDGCRIDYQPLGVVLIIGAWNYPVQLIFAPMLGAIAAGNAVCVKPSELAPNSAQLMAKLLPKYFPDLVTVINGGANETTELLKLKFDKIMYTGSSRVGKIIAKAAAETLTPTILELGGKSPCYVDTNTNSEFLRVTGRRIAWGRFSNCGQTCIAPDYVLCHRSMFKPLTQAIKNATLEFYGDNPQKSVDYARVVNLTRFKVLQNFIKAQPAEKIVLGGVIDENDLYIAPTIIADVKDSDSVMQEEIFGPILPLLHVEDYKEAVAYINAHDKPLALYVFSEDSTVQNNVVDNTTSGSCLVNDTLMQITVNELPFGGVGNSGMDAYHGKFSFECFSHKRSVMVKNLGLEMVNSLRYPPYSASKLSWLNFAIAKKPNGLVSNTANALLPFFKAFLLVAVVVLIVKPAFLQGHIDAATNLFK